jgi:glyoxylase-like metal-dependent hydrolase (beta-lactamase superfamily II)
MGGNAAVASAYGCRITIPAGEVRHVDPWTPQSVWMAEFDQKADPFRYDDTLAADDAFEAAGFPWEVVAAPGHDMDAVMFWQRDHRVLVTGDALWQDGMGFVWPEEGRNPAIEAALDTLAAIERLDPAVVIPGHGAPFEGAREALGRARGRLAAFAADPRRNARHVAKSLFVFALLEREAMRIDQVAGYLRRVPSYQRLSERFLGLADDAFAEWLLADLARGGAITVADGVARPNLPA